MLVAEQGFEPRPKAPKTLPIYRGMAASADIREYDVGMKTFTAVVERDADTGLFVGWVPGFRGAHSQGETLDELRANLREVVEMLLEDGAPEFASEFIGTQTVEVA
jgi:predicted RNase H-like HicB family nuclease